MTNFAFEFGFWNGTCTLVIEKIKNKKEEEEEEALRFVLAHLRRRFIRPGTQGKCPKTIVIVGYI